MATELFHQPDPREGALDAPADRLGAMVAFHRHAREWGARWVVPISEGEVL